MIFAAGLGTRLRPYTNDRPKALVEVGGDALLGHCLRRLKEAGIESVVVNVHHFADKVEQYLKDRGDIGMEILVSDERDALLETGGGLQKAAPFLRDKGDFLVCNVDILSNIDFRRMAAAHNRSGALATLALRQRQTSRYLLWDESLRLVGWKNEKSGKYRWCKEAKPQARPLAFSGIHLINPEIFSLMQRSGKFSIIETYLSLGGNHVIQGYPHDDDIWMDVGKAAGLPDAEKLVPRIFPEGLV